MGRVIWDVENWYRVGHGRGFGYRAQSEEVIAVLEEVLPEEYGPYSLVNVNLVKQGKVYVQRATTHPIAELVQIATPKNWDFFILSRAITGDVDPSQAASPGPFCSLNGMLNLQHRERSGWVGIVGKVSNEQTGEVVEHVEYMKVYNAVLRGFKRHKLKA